MTKHDAYFDQPEGAASVLKHALLGGYVPVFVGKTGQRAESRRVVYVDGFAGAGEHADGAKGSPLVAAAIAAKLSATRTLDCIFVEKKPALVRQLNDSLERNAPGLTHKVLLGDFVEYVEPIITRAARAPMFAFLDPFGVGVPYEAVLRLLNRNGSGRRAWPPTEVLLNFSAEGVRRIGGKLAAGHDDEKTYARLDAACGGPWWRQRVLDAASEVGFSAAAHDIALAYQGRIAHETGCRSWLVPVRRKPTHQPLYYLLFFTRHPDGMWEFGEALSIAQAQWRQAWPLADRAARTAKELATGQDALMPLEDVAGDEMVEAALEAEWVIIIRDNLLRLLEPGLPFVVGQRQEDVYGTTLGLARGKHVRKAAQSLKAAGLTDSDGRGDVERILLAPAGATLAPTPFPVRNHDPQAAVTRAAEVGPS